MDWWAGVKVIEIIKLGNPKSVSFQLDRAHMYLKNGNNIFIVYLFGIHGPSCWIIDSNNKTDAGMPLNGPLENVYGNGILNNLPFLLDRWEC